MRPRRHLRPLRRPPLADARLRRHGDGRPRPLRVPRRPPRRVSGTRHEIDRADPRARSAALPQQGDRAPRHQAREHPHPGLARRVALPEAAPSARRRPPHDGDRQAVRLWALRRVDAGPPGRRSRRFRRLAGILRAGIDDAPALRRPRRRHVVARRGDGRDVPGAPDLRRAVVSAVRAPRRRPRLLERHRRRRAGRQGGGDDAAVRTRAAAPRGPPPSRARAASDDRADLHGVLVRAFTTDAGRLHAASAVDL
mmetsp:Transcript_26771/g.107233  ORF Transcript_26771/g.107233 Transcript_26771/m.107233 type:complete len:253 (+) Transcript_26771:462-1220(+)